MAHVLIFEQVSLASFQKHPLVGTRHFIFRYQFSTAVSVYVNSTVVYPIHSTAKKFLKKRKLKLFEGK